MIYYSHKDISWPSKKESTTEFVFAFVFGSEVVLGPFSPNTREMSDDEEFS